MSIGAWARRLDASRRDDRGAVAIIVVLFILIFMVLLAFVIDFGRQYAAKAQLQNAVDAAALAAGQSLCSATTVTPVQTEAQTYAGYNGVTIALSDATVNLATSPRTVRVAASQPISTVFGQFAGVSQLGVDADATVSAICGIRKFGIYADQNLTFNGSNSDAIFVYAGDTFTPNGTGTDITYLETDPTGVVNAGATVTTLSTAGQGLSAQAYAYIFPTAGGKKLDGTGETKWDGVTEISYVDEMSNSTGIRTPTSGYCGANSNNTGNALNATGVTTATRFVCSGSTSNSVVTSGLATGFNGSVLAKGVIDLKGPGGSPITINSKLIYSEATGDAIKLTDVVLPDADTIVYAPNGNVIVSAAGNVVNATIIGKSVTFSGAKQSSTAEGSILPGGNTGIGVLTE